jgi:hypothetical protein
MYLGKKTYRKLLVLIQMWLPPRPFLSRVHSQLYQFTVNYAEDLSRVVKKILLLSEVAALSRKFFLDSFEDVSHHSTKRTLGIGRDEFHALIRSSLAADDEASHISRGGEPAEYDSNQDGLVIDPNEYELDGGLSPAQKARINELLGTW